MKNIKNVKEVLALTLVFAATAVLFADPAYERGVDGKDHAVLYRNIGG